MERDGHVLHAKRSDDAQCRNASENDGGAGPKIHVHESVT
jgi:hypothetical protein